MDNQKFSENEQPKNLGTIPVFKYPGIKEKDIFRERNMEVPVQKKTDVTSRKVLVAEDEEINFFFLKEALRKENITFFWGKNGQEALDLFIKNPDIEIVLMDIKMPIMDGYEALRCIKAIRNVPVIAQTAYAYEGESKMLNAGFDEFLSKPINIKLLRLLIDKYLNAGNLSPVLKSAI